MIHLKKKKSWTALEAIVGWSRSCCLPFAEEYVQFLGLELFPVMSSVQHFCFRAIYKPFGQTFGWLSYNNAIEINGVMTMNYKLGSNTHLRHSSSVSRDRDSEPIMLQILQNYNSQHFSNCLHWWGC